jgi:two-component system, LytTR family, response regulator LytT
MHDYSPLGREESFMIRTLIVDDEAPARSELRYLLEQHPDISVIAEASSGEEAIHMVHELSPDVVFLDIHLHDMDGIQAAQALEQSGSHPVIVYATAYDEYAIKAFETEAADYILKPFSTDRIEKTIDRLRRRLQKEPYPLKEAGIESTLRQIVDTLQPAAKSQTSTRIPVEKANSIVFVDVDSIVYTAVEGRHTRIYTKTSNFPASFSLQELERRLPEINFCRIHRAYIVNLHAIKEFIPWFKGTVQVKMDDMEETVLPVSRSLVKELKARLGF